MASYLLPALAFNQTRIFYDCLVVLFPYNKFSKNYFFSYCIDQKFMEIASSKSTS